MAIPTTRQQLIDYSLRALGAPVLEINVDQDQLEDRVDEALDIFRLYHYDGIERIYLKHQVTSSTLTITGSNAASFKPGVTITGSSSNAKAQVVQLYDQSQNSYDSVDASIIHIRMTFGQFVAGETITDTANNSATLTSANFYTAGDIDNGWIEIPDLVYGVSRVLPLYQGTSSSKNIFDLQYQLRLNDLYDLASTSLIYYVTVMQHLATLDLVLNGKPTMRFNRLQNRLHIDINWKSGTTVKVGDWIIVDCYRALDPVEFSKVWNEPWLKRYVTSLFKKQWGTNLKKFSGLQLPGGVTLNGDKIYMEAIQEVQSLEQEIQHKSAPLDFFVG